MSSVYIYKFMQISDFFTLLNCFIWGIFENLDVWIQIILFFEKSRSWRDPGEVKFSHDYTTYAVGHNTPGNSIQAHIFLIEKAFDEIRAFDDL